MTEERIKKELETFAYCASIFLFIINVLSGITCFQVIINGITQGDTVLECLFGIAFIPMFILNIGFCIALICVGDYAIEALLEVTEKH